MSRMQASKRLRHRLKPTAYSSDGEQVVSIGKETSDYYPITSGVAQGSVSASKSLRQDMPRDIRKDGSTFSQALFNDEEVVKIRKDVIKTEFIKGMVKATLNANYYGGYMVQDAAYSFKGVDVFEDAAKAMDREGRSDFAELYRSQSKSLKEYNEEFVTTWHLQDAESIVMGDAVKAYLEDEREIVRYKARFLAIAMLPCHMLWPWIANQLIDFVGEWNPYYKGWFQENQTEPNHKGHLEKFVDSHFGPEEKKQALTIFRKAMQNELNFFLDAYKESL